MTNGAAPGDPAGSTAESIADDEAKLAEYASALADAMEASVPGWVKRCVAARSGGSSLADEAGVAGARAAAEVGPAVRELLSTDVDAQRQNPLALLRAAVRYPTAVLSNGGVAAVERDAFATRNFPDDLYDLTPASFADVDPSLHEPGIVWGAAKAHVILRRRRAEGRR